MATGTIFPVSDISTTNWAISAAATFFGAVTDGNPATYVFSQVTGAQLVLGLGAITFPGGHGLQTLTASAQLSVDAGMAGRLVIMDSANAILASSGTVTGANVVVSAIWSPTAVVAAATANTTRLGFIADVAATGQFVRCLDQAQAVYVTAPAPSYFVKGII